MAKTVVIRITNESAPGSPSPDGKDNSGSRSSATGSVIGDALANDSETLKFAKSIAKPYIAMIKQSAETGLNRYLEMSEDYKAQMGVQNGKAVIGIAMSIADSAKTLSKAGGAIGGTAGAIIGGAIGVLIGIQKANYQAMKTLENQNRTLQEQAYSLYFTTARAGMVNYSRGTEN